METGSVPQRSEVTWPGLSYWSASHTCWCFLNKWMMMSETAVWDRHVRHTWDSLLGEDQVWLEADDVLTDLLDVLFLHLQDPGKVFLLTDLNVRLNTRVKGHVMLRCSNECVCACESVCSCTVLWWTILFFVSDKLNEPVFMMNVNKVTSR